MRARPHVGAARPARDTVSEALSSHSARATSRGSTPYLLAPPYLLMPKGKPRHR
ncbi:hypothetical protein [Streptomyces sp. NPDC059970]|uniref:hypothetical protein n=1 Tax=Streptomyces sp. NPDC059970 TaxID=3347019 RepID=UPI00367F98A1